ncbi:hypothetical protein OZX67_01225 [Bifidobacterium sp. ESL0728]|uniref:hypothetical protein n=1 Tax=Bifidobacterium sp. ESL0728 TaxID=2983220 RepID=UPI0023F8513C|nr:hypothetical protein [Bifidobacterium sp. ESL0728]WEV59223.1 hypothetical protein OZX67_01225 [Bifidobacterium sp. ESL0728]
MVNPYPGLFFDAVAWQRLDARQQMLFIARALHIVHPSWRFAGITAANIYGLEYRRNLHDGSTFIASHQSPKASKNPKLHYVSCNELEGKTYGELPVVSTAEALVECGARYPFRDVLPMYDSAFRLGLASASEVKGIGEKRGADYLRIQRLLNYADSNSENGGESFCRGTIIEEGFPVPKLQVEFPKPDGSTYRVDFLYHLRDGRDVAVEFDGMGKYVDSDMTKGRPIEEIINDEQQRERFLLRDCGISEVVRLRYRDVAQRKVMIQKLLSAKIPCVKSA